jgi:hypothetical protein
MDIKSPRPAPADGSVPYPPPFLWLKRVAVAGVVLVIVLGVARVWWGWDANRRLAAELEAIAARGEPVELRYFNSPAVAEDVNAVPLLRRAGEIILERREGPYSPSNSNLTWSQQLPYPQIWHDTAAISIEVNWEAIELVAEARARGEVGWDLDLEGKRRSTRHHRFFNLNAAPFLSSGEHLFRDRELMSLSSIRALANQIGDTALYLHFNGNDAEAIDRLFDILFIAQSLNEQPTLIPYLVGTGIEALALSRINIIGTGLRVEDAETPADPQATYPADREQVRWLINHLLDEQPRRDRLLHVLQAERLLMLHAAEDAYDKSVLVSPMFRRDMVKALRGINAAVEAAAAPDWAAVSTIVDMNPPQAANPWYTTSERHDLVRLISRHSGFNMVFVTHYRAIMERRMMAAALAVRLYHNDHGAFPPDLASLVPRYLPYLPIDPHAEMVVLSATT